MKEAIYKQYNAVIKEEIKKFNKQNKSVALKEITDKISRKNEVVDVQSKAYTVVNQEEAERLKKEYEDAMAKYQKKETMNFTPVVTVQNPAMPMNPSQSVPTILPPSQKVGASRV